MDSRTAVTVDSTVIVDSIDPAITANFNSIIERAINQDVVGLANLLDQDVSVDLRCGVITPIYELASRGEVGAVELLLSEFSASMHEAIAGYAFAGNVYRVNIMLARGAAPTDAIRQYAKAGNVDECEKLCRQTINESKIFGAIVCYLAAMEGYILARMNDEAEKKLTTIRSICKQLFYFSTRISVLGGSLHPATDSEYRGIILRRVASQNYISVKRAIYAGLSFDAESGSYLASGDVEFNANTAYGLAISGNEKKIIELEESELINDALVKGYAFSGRYQLVEKMLAKGASLNAALIGYAHGGHISQVNELITRGGEVRLVFAAYARFGHLKALNNLALKNIKLFLNAGVIDNTMSGMQVFDALYIGGYLHHSILIRRAIYQLPELFGSDVFLNIILRPLNQSHPVENLTTVSALNIFNGNRHLTPFGNKVKQMSFYMNEHKATNAQVEAWLNPALRTWVIHGHSYIVNGQLPKDAFNLITSKAFGITERDASTLYERICLPMFRKILIEQLINYINQSTPISFFQFIKTYNLFSNVDAEICNPNVPRAKKLLETLSSDQSPTSYVTTLFKEQAEIHAISDANKDEYTTLITRASARF